MKIQGMNIPDAVVRLALQQNPEIRETRKLVDLKRFDVVRHDHKRIMDERSFILVSKTEYTGCFETPTVCWTGILLGAPSEPLDLTFAADSPYHISVVTGMNL
jgi:hypothetical protein